MQPDNAKAVYRKGQALKNQNKYEEGEEFISKFLDENQDSIEKGFKNDIIKLLNEIKVLRAKFGKKEKKFLKICFND